MLLFPESHVLCVKKVVHIKESPRQNFFTHEICRHTN